MAESHFITVTDHLVEIQLIRKTNLMNKSFQDAVKYSDENNLQMLLVEYSGSLSEDVYKKYMNNSDESDSDDYCEENIIYVYIRNNVITEVF
jgi:hypothetical protein